MTLPDNILHSSGPVRTTVALLLFAAALLVASGDLLAERADNGCQDECCDSCRDLVDCVCCAHAGMGVVDSGYEPSGVDTPVAGILVFGSVDCDTCLAFPIDHPPQNFLLKC
ncbi:MAG: hypothetical protein KKA42_10970 [candidate division Zixibacteria bacterium]|nr:hypothetical protein [candidate division Zixibacteria bacterium]